MAIQNGEQILPTNAFEGFVDEDDDSLSSVEDEDNDSSADDESAQIIADTIESGSNDLDDDKGLNDSDEDSTLKAKDKDKEDKVEDDDDFIPDIEDEDAPLAATSEEGEDAPKLTKKEKFDRYSRSVQRRINKVSKQREELRAENYQLQDRIANIENTMQRAQVNNEASILDNRLANATAMKQQLLEEGEYAQAAEVDNDIIEMRIRRNQMQAPQQQAPQQQAPQQQAPQQQAPQQQVPQQQQQQQAPDVPNVQKQWIQNNKRFGAEPGYTSFVNEAYDNMIAQGYDPQSPSMYAELDKRIGRAPSQSAISPTNKAASKPRRQSAPTPNTGQQAQASSSGMGLTEADKTNMRGWGLNPNNANERKEWLQNKRRKA